MSDLIILGSIKYDFLDLNSLIDSYDRTLRCNLGIPGNNNGTRSDIQILNCHVYKNFVINKNSYEQLQKLYPKIYEKNIIDFKKYLSSGQLKEIIPQRNPHVTLPICRSILKRLKCPIVLKKLPRMGLFGILYCIHLKKTKNKFSNISVCGMGLDFTYKNTYYRGQHLKFQNNTSNCKYHNWENEHEIMLWLHNNNHIDATLCLLEKDEENKPYLNGKLLEPKKRTLEKLKLYYGDIAIKY